MKKSRAVPLSLVSTLAAAAIASGCGSFGRRQGWQTCVDRTTDYSVDQQNCENERRYAHPYGYVPHYYWYYYPRGYYWGAPGIGMRVPVGGTYMTSPHMTAPMAHTGVSAVRGGFGSSATSHAGS
ncbi:MAG TPA: hypothetical protein VEU08_08380 [Vicinamibacterales bacterium]|nr:hypothetical protein [Vicinamibacterales bacterium]